MPVLLESNSPHICREDFDKEAVGFLEKYYPEALQRPMAVPILEVARSRMGLRVVKKRLTEDLSILGQMCFTNGIEEIYIKETNEYKEVKVRCGTMIIDPDTIAERNEGCENNTIAHEAFHWHKHRDYYIAVSVVDLKKAVKIRSGFDKYDESRKATWSDEDWMEWQARGIAPRILMPPVQFDEMAKHFIAKFPASHNLHRYSLHRWVVKSLADFFKVSKQSAEIRLDEKGYHLRE
jgi:hypothetical protein